MKGKVLRSAVALRGSGYRAGPGAFSVAGAIFEFIRQRGSVVGLASFLCAAFRKAVASALVAVAAIATLSLRNLPIAVSVGSPVTSKSTGRVPRQCFGR